MGNKWRSLKILLLSFVFIFLSTNVGVSAATKGGKCSKVGQTQITKGVSYVCVKVGSRAVWQVKPAVVKGNKS